MNPEREALARHRLERARAALAVGDRLISSGDYLDAANRLYYTVFHAARALLAAEGIRSASHKGVIAMFQKHFVKNELIDRDTAKALPRLFKARQDADYEDFASVSAESAQAARRGAFAFVNECERVLDEMTAIE